MSFQPACSSKKYLLLLMLALLAVPMLPGRSVAQTPFDAPKLIADSAKKMPAVIRQPRTKNFGRAAAELMTFEVGVWAMNRYIRQEDWAKISWKTTGYNLNPAHWEWDNDEFQTNQFGHPYHGNLYFNSFRTNGYNFWQSAAAAGAGSYLWETFGENQAPAPNDFINTTFGGVVLGEMTYRLSNKIINNRTRGFKRQLNEVLAFVINPVNGVNRIIDGRWGRIGRNTTQRDSSSVSAEFEGGARAFGADDANLLKQGKFGWYGRARLIYGTTYENYRVPFSNIVINAELGKDDSTVLNNVSVYGSLAGWPMRTNDKVRHLAVLSANYDYLRNEAFLYGAQSVKINLFSEFKLPANIKFNTSFSAGGIILAAVPDEYKFRGRNYDYGSGANISAGGGINIKDHFYYSLNYSGAWLVTINGNDSHYFLHAVTSEIRYAFNDTFSITAQPGYFALEGKYNNYPNVTDKYPFLRVGGRYTVKFK